MDLDPRLAPLAEQLLAETQELARAQTPGGPINYDSPQGQKVRAMLLDMKGQLEAELRRQQADLQGTLEQLRKTVKEQEEAAAAPPPPTVRLEDLEVGQVTLRFKDDHSPEAAKMHAVVEALLKLGKE